MSDHAEPDLTPMLDVVFILLIFFIVTATFVMEIGIDMPVENEKPKEISENQSIILDLRADSRYYLDRHQIDKRALEHNLARLHAEDPDRSFVLRASPNASTNAFVYAIDIANVIGLNVAIARTDEGT